MLDVAALPREWQLLTVDDIKAPVSGAIAIGPFGSRMKSDNYTPSGVRVIRGLNLTRGRQLSGSFVFVSEDFAAGLGHAVVAPGDIVLPHRGAIGAVGIVPAGPSHVISSSLMKFTVDTRIASPEFLYYYFRSRVGRQEILRFGSTVGTPGIGQPLASLRTMRVVLPPLDEQMRVVEVLGVLEDKLDVNRALHQRAMDVAKVRIQASRGPESALLGEVATIRKGLSYTGAGLSDEGMPMVNLANAATFGGFKRTGWKHYTGDYKPRHVARGGNLLVANTDLTWKLEALGWPMLLPDDVEQALFSQDISIIDFHPQWAHLRLPTWAHLFTTEARQRVDAMAYGTTVARFAPEALTGLSVPVIEHTDPALADAEALLARGWAAERESETLIKLREALLPALMSGRLRVREAEELLGEAV